MRRVMAVAAFALLLVVPLAWSQRGGGARGGGMSHSAGMSRGAGFSSHSGGMYGGSMGGYHSGYHGCYNCGHTYPHYPYNSSHRYYLSFYGRYGYRYPYYGYGYYWPWWWDNSSYDSGSSDQSDAAARQIDDLSQQVQQLREHLAASQYAQPSYGPPPPVAQTQPTPQAEKPVGKSGDRFTASPDLATVLVFRDQRIQEVKNYAIVGKTLVVIADQRQRKIPLADLDLDKTTQLNEERGIDFQIPR